MNWSLEKVARISVTRPPAAAGGRSAGEEKDAALLNGCLRLEISARTLLRLLASGRLCAADFRCLDCESKRCVWRLLLKSASRSG